MLISIRRKQHPTSLLRRLVPGLGDVLKSGQAAAESTPTSAKARAEERRLKKEAEVEPGGRTDGTEYSEMKE